MYRSFISDGGEAAVFILGHEVRASLRSVHSHHLLYKHLIHYTHCTIHDKSTTITTQMSWYS